MLEYVLASTNREAAVTLGDGDGPAVASGGFETSDNSTRRS
jgi:hypothetical protein